MFELLNEKFKESEVVLIGLGDEVRECCDSEEGHLMINRLAQVLEHHNYFIVSTMDDDFLRKSNLNQKRIVYPYKAELDEEEAKQWDLYNKWLGATLAKKLLILEAGEGFKNPNIIRWPFERITMINNTAFLYRIHSEFSQIPVEIQEKAFSLSENAFKALKDWLKDCE